MGNKENVIERNSSLDILRVITAIGVVILHFSTASNGGLLYAESHSMNYYYLLATCAVCSPAVNIFILLSGYFSVGKTEIKKSKVAYILLMTIVVRLLFYIFSLLIGREIFEITKFIRVLLPINYYVVLYLTLYIISPYINIVINKLSQKEYLRLLVTIISLFSFWTFFVDCLKQFIGGELLDPLSTIASNGSNGGYTLINFIMMYIIGGYLKRFDINVRKNLLGIILGGCFVFIFLMSLVSQKSWNYNNPIVIVFAVCIIIMFNGIKIRSNPICKLSNATLSCYLIHVFVFEYMDISNYVELNVFALAGIQLIIALIVYLISFIFTILFNYITNPLMKVLKNRDKSVNDGS